MRDRATIFGSEAQAYDQFRPSYPTGVIDMIVDGDPDLVVDVGCGTGIAARQVIDREVQVLGVEPDPDMAAVARAKGVQVTVAPLEQWASVPCDVLYAAQSWHWIDARQGAMVAAEALRPGGRWIAFWNFEVDQGIDTICENVYKEIAPELLTEMSMSRLVDDGAGCAEAAAGLAETRCFEPMTTHLVNWTEEIDAEHFVMRIDTHSSHRLLDLDKRHEVRKALIEALGNNSRLQVDYATKVYTARRLLG